MKDEKLLCADETYAIRGAAFDVYKEMGNAFDENVYQPDFFCFGKIIVELKVCAATADVHRAQLLNYLRITGCRLGLLINFGTYPKVSIERFVL